MNGVETLGLVIIGIAVVLAFVEVGLGQRARRRHTGAAMRTSWESRRGELDREWAWSELAVVWCAFIVVILLLTVNVVSLILSLILWSRR